MNEMSTEDTSNKDSMEHYHQQERSWHPAKTHPAKKFNLWSGIAINWPSATLLKVGELTEPWIWKQSMSNID